MRGSKLAFAAAGIVALTVFLAPGAAAEHGCGSADDPGAIAGTTNEDGDGLPYVGACVAGGDHFDEVEAHAGEDYDETWWGYADEELRVDAHAEVHREVTVNGDEVTEVDYAEVEVSCDTDEDTEDPNRHERCSYIDGEVEFDTDGPNTVEAELDVAHDPDDAETDVWFDTEHDADESLLP